MVNKEKKIIGIGYNGMPNGCSDDELPWERTRSNWLETKYPYGLCLYDLFKHRQSESDKKSVFCSIAILSVRPSIHLSVTWVDQSKTVQARITKCSPSVAGKTLVLATVLKLFHKFEGDHPERGC